MTHYISPDRRGRIASVGIAATVCLYLLMAFVAEPTHSLAATSANTVVSLDVVSTASITCSATVSITTSTGATPTGNSTYGTGGTMATCVPITNNSLGYTLKWNVLTGSGGYGTGHLTSNNFSTTITGASGGAYNSTSPAADLILAYKVATAGTPELWASPNAANPASTSRWAGRVKSSSTTVAGAGSVTWGTDGSSEKFLNVGTGAAVSLIKRTTETASTGDLEYIQFKANIGSTSAQPTGTYKATVIFTIVDN
jgi:hypothetical protein